jgi:hypothetical protein
MALLSREKQEGTMAGAADALYIDVIFPRIYSVVLFLRVREEYRLRKDSIV